MIDEKAMIETFQKLLHQDKLTILSKLGTPDVSYNTFVAYQKNHLWLVLFFKDGKKNGSFKSELQSATIFDDTLHLIWSTGIRLFEHVENAIHNPPSSVQEFIREHGTPHAQLGGMGNAFQYLTEDGQFLIITYHHDQITGIKHVKLPDLI